MTTAKTIAVLFDDAERTAEVGRMFISSDIQVELCTGSDHLYKFAMNSRIDAIVVEHRLSSFLTGLDILQRLADDLVRPVAVLVGDLTSEEKQRAAAIGIKNLLDASAANASIVAMTQGALQTEIHSGVPIPFQARRLVRHADYIRPMPQLLVRIAGFLGDENASVHELAQEISADQRVTAELLKIINNSSTGLAERVTRVQDAVALIGIKRTVALVLSTHILKAAHPTNRTLPPEFEQRLRVRSILTATIAASYASMAGHPTPDTAYLLALLQDLGILVMALELGRQYQKVLERCVALPVQLQLAAYEQREFGFTHADVSAALLQKWELPPTFIRLVYAHHSVVDEFDGHPNDRGLLQAIQFAEAVAEMKDRITPQRQQLVQRLATRWGDMDLNKLKNCLAQGISRAKELTRVFNVPMPDEAQLQTLIEDLADEAEFSLEELQALTQMVPLDDEESGEFNAAPACARPLILAVDDDRSCLKIITHFLRNSEFEVLTGTRFSQIASRCQDAHAILLDLHLADESGIRILEHLRESGVDIPVLMISNDCTRQSVIEALQAGVNDYIPKPFSPETLLSKLRHHLSRHYV